MYIAEFKHKPPYMLVKVLLCILSQTIGFNALAAIKDDLMTSNKIDAIVRKTVHDLSKNMNLNGSILVGKKDELVYVQQFGFADIADNTPTSIDTQYLIGSVTKQFAATALLKALLDSNTQSGIDENDVDNLKNSIQLDLNRPVAYFLPKENSIWAGAMPKWANQITVHQLLTHTSGIIDCCRLSNYNEVVKNPPNFVDFIKLFKDEDLEFEPGTEFSYSNSGYIIIGAIIEQITSKKLDVYLENTFFKPLSMNATHYMTNGTLHDIKKERTRFSNLARGYYFDFTVENPILYEVPQYEPMQILLASGSIISTAPDLLCWNDALYSGKIIPSFLVDIMVQPYISTGATNVAYGYGVMIMKPGTDSTYYFHGGLTFGFITNLTYIPSSHISIISLTNVMFNWNQLAFESEKLKSEQPLDLSEAEKLTRVKQIINDRYPNVKKFDLMILDKAIIERLAGFKDK